MKTLTQLIQPWKFDWINPDITEEHFPAQEGDERKKEYKLYHFDHNILSEDAIKEMAQDDYVPATLRDLLHWKDWNGKDWVVALRSVWQDSDGNRYVPVLYWDGGRRELALGWFGRGWPADDRFLAVRKGLGRSESRTIEPLDLNGETIEVKGVKYRLTKLWTTSLRRK